MATPIPANVSKKLLNKLPILNLRISRHEEAAVRNERRNLFSAGPGQGEKKNFRGRDVRDKSMNRIAGAGLDNT